MRRTLFALFRLVPGEGRKVLVFSLLAALLQSGVSIGMAASDSLFLARLGVDMLPVVYIAMPVLMTLYAPVAAWLQSRFGLPKVLLATQGALVLGGLFFGFGGDYFGDAAWLPFSMKLYVGLWYIALYTFFWNFADDYFDILDGKRLYGIFSAGSAFGGMCGAGAVSLLADILPPAKMFLAWAVCALLAVPVILYLLRRFRHIEVDPIDGSIAEKPGHLLRFVGEAFRGSRFAVALTVVCFMAVLLTALMEYLSFGLLSQGKSAEQLVVLFGHLHVVANAVTLLVNLVIFNRLVGRFGVNNTALLLPLTYVAVFAIFYLKAGMTGALIAFFAYQSLLVSVEYNNINLLFNALPGAVKRQLRTFIEAMCEPVATALAGVFLLTWATALGNNRVALVGLVGALVSLGLALFVRHDYVRALAINLRRDWLDFGSAARRMAEWVSAEDCRHFKLRAEASEDRREQEVCVSVLTQVGSPHATHCLLGLLERTREEDAEALRPAIRRMLSGLSGARLAEVLLWLEGERFAATPALMDEFAAAGLVPVRHAAAWQASHESSLRPLGVLARWQRPNLESSKEALAEVDQLLGSKGVEQRMGVRALGYLALPRHVPELLAFLDDSDASLRVEALRALLRVAGSDSSGILPRLIGGMGRAGAEERSLILEITAKVGDVSCLVALFKAARDFSAAERHQLEDLVQAMGLKTVPVLISALRSPATPSGPRIQVARILSRLALPQLELLADDMIAEELGRAAQAAELSRLHTRCSSHSAWARLLARHHHDAAAELLDFVLQLLSLIGRLPDFDLIRASLRSSSARHRANALETIEQSCPRPLFVRLKPLISALHGWRSGKDSRPAPGAELTEALLASSRSADPVEACAALLAAADCGVGAPTDWLARALGGDVPSETLHWLHLLRTRMNRHGLPDSPQSAAHPVDLVSALACCPSLEDVRVDALRYLASHGQILEAPPGAELVIAGQQGGNTHVVVSGRLQAWAPGASQAEILQLGSIINLEAFTGFVRTGARIVSDGAVLVSWSSQVLGNAIEVHPDIGVGLYRLNVEEASA